MMGTDANKLSDKQVDCQVRCAIGREELQEGPASMFAIYEAGEIIYKYTCKEHTIDYLNELQQESGLSFSGPYPVNLRLNIKVND